MKLVSVVVPVYNLEEHILCNLESLEKQTYKSIEVIVVNDGSIDNTLEVVNEFIKGKSLKYKVLSIDNGGVSKARNIGMRECQGEYVLLLDGDDRLKPQAIEAMVKVLEERDADICFAGYEEYDNFHGEPVYQYKHHKNYVPTPIPGYEALQKKLVKEIWVCTGSGLYKRAMLEANNIWYSEGRAYGEDLEFIGKALFNANRVVSVEEDLLEILNRNTSAMHVKFSNKHVDALVTNRNFYNYVDKNTINISKEQLEEVKLGIDFDYVNVFLGIVKKAFKEYSLLSPFKAIETIKELNITMEGINVNKVKRVIGRFKRFEIEVFRFSKLLYFYCAKLILAVKERR